MPDAAERSRHHTEQAALAEQENPWFAAEFHLRRVLRDNPDNAAVKTRLATIVYEASLSCRYPPDGGSTRSPSCVLLRPGADKLGLMPDLTRLLEAAQAGDRQAAAQLLPLVYDELRKLATARMAAEAPGHTLDATALVHFVETRPAGNPH